MDENRIDVAEDMSTSKSAAGKPKRAARVSEIETLRTANRKVFRMDDGSEQAVFCSGMTCERSDADSPLELNADGKHYRKRSGSFNAAFSCDENNDELFSMERDTHRITISAAKNNGQHNAGKVPTLRNKAFLFENVAENTDMEYSVVSGGVKENIVVKQQANAYRYPFVIHCENVSVESDSTAKQVKFVSSETGEEVFFIPAPFMVDANGIVSTGVNYELENLSDGNIQLTVVADSNWINAQGRAFPVTIDPQVMVSGSTNINTYSWVDGSITAPAEHTVGKVAVTDPDTGEVSYTTNRMYLHFNMPTLPNNPRIKKAELVFYQKSFINNVNHAPKLGLFQVTEDITTGTFTPAQNTRLIDFEALKIVVGDSTEMVSYNFDITRLIDAINSGESTHQNLVMEMMETPSNDSNITLYGSADADYSPTICVTYESSYGVNTSFRAHTHEIGRFGQGSVDLACGNLMFECQDFAWAGNRMPVTLKHLYNGALGLYQYTKNSAIKLETADFSAMKLGFGWKLNIMQSMMPVSFQHEGEMYDGYVYIGENSEEVYFKQCEDDSDLFEAVADSDLVYNATNRTLAQGEETYQFDTSGRLVSISDEYSQMVITYTDDRITSVTDGVGRAFNFAYNSGGQLISITAPDESAISYTYFGNMLNGVSYPNGTRVSIGWASNKPVGIVLNDADNNALYRVCYSFSGNRVAKVSEYGTDATEGKASTYSYSASARKTTVRSTEATDSDETNARVTTTVYTFDHDGNVIGQYVYTEDTGCMGAEGEGSGIHPYFSDGGVRTISMSRNLLTEHSFESNRSWQMMNGSTDGASITFLNDQSLAKYGKRFLCVESTNSENTEIGVMKIVNLSAGEYTFSAYLRPLFVQNLETTHGAYIRVVDTSGNVLAVSESLSGYDTDYVRMVVSFTLAEAQQVHVEIFLNGEGTVYADAVQLEASPFVTPYNILQEGDFDYLGWAWNMSSGVEYSSDTYFHSGNSIKMTGDLDSVCYASQSVPVRANRAARETFTLSGWAKGCAVPDRQRKWASDPQFRLRAVIHYNDGDYEDTSTETITADFSPCTEDWQYTSVQFSKSKYRTVDHIEVFCDYDYNYGTAYFDDIQLIRDSLETNLTASDFVDETDTAVYDEEDTDAADTISAPEFAELMDEFGNTLTETTYTDGEFGTIYRSFGYDENGNDLIRETDARGNVTTYTVDSATSRNQAITDRCGNKTLYEYDTSGRTTKVTSKNASDAELANVSYSYDPFDNLTEIVRGDGLKYVLKYNEFHNLESIGVDGKTEKLVSYTYKTGNGRLKQISYANGDHMKATYNTLGQMTAEKWYDATGSLTCHYKYFYDNQGNIVRSVDIFACKEYSYIYDEGRIIRAVECDVTIDDDGMITAKTLVHTLRYVYDEQGNLIRKHSIPATSPQQITFYENPEDGNPVVKFQLSQSRSVTSHSKNDSFGRKEFDELQLGLGNVSRQFLYHAGETTEEHKNSSKLKSTPTTNLVSQIILSDGRTLSYEYDAEERITKVTEAADDGSKTVTVYTYDAQGQLLTETVDGVVVNAMTYDSYGNILTKNGVTYTYGDSVWKDKLTAVGNETISYDAQGNPTTYLGHTLTWEKGRQLKSFDSNAYTYNANGIRTSKTINGEKHTYTLDGAKILCETWQGIDIEGNECTNVMMPLYDNEGSVCGILYNSMDYYFLRNLQGDIIAITNTFGRTVAKYSYDAWGVCTIVEDASGLNIAAINPFRYRGYYYDAEIDMYYLQSRYYNPETGRFLNADASTYVAIDYSAVSCNLFTYCKNTPTTSVDAFGFNSAVIAQGDTQWVYMLASIVPAVAAAKAGIVAAIKSALAFLWNVFVVVGLVLAVIILIAAVCVTAAKVLALVQTAVKTNKYSGARGYVVYVLTRKAKDPSRIFYVGRTKNFSKRMASHYKTKKPCVGYIVVVCKTYAASRAIEQAVLSACIVSKVFAIDKGKIPNGSNKMRGIAKDSVKNFKNNLSDLSSLMSCTTESDLLALMEW